MKRARLLLADDHVLLLDAFTALLEPRFEVVGTVTNGRALVAAAEKLVPDVVLLDISMPLLNGMEAGRKLKRLLPEVALIFLTVNEDPNIAADAFRMGASAFLLKKSAASEMCAAIEHAMAGEPYVTGFAEEGMARFLREPNPSKEAECLTSRQLEVLNLLAEGHTMREVGVALRVATRTVAFHKYRMMKNLGIKNSAGLIHYAVKRGIVSSS